MSGYRKPTPTPRRLRLCAGILAGEVRWYHFRKPMAQWKGRAVTAEVRKLVDAHPQLATVPDPATRADAYTVVALTVDGERWRRDHLGVETVQPAAGVL